MNWPAPRRILLIHFGQLGDAVMALPAAVALRQTFPQARVDVLAARGGDAIFRMAGFDHVWAADRAAWKRSPARALAALPALVWRLRRQAFDCSVDLHSFKETNLLAWIAGIPRRVAMLRPTRSWPALINDPPQPDDTQGRLIDRYCAVLAPLGAAVTDRVPRLTPPPASRSTAPSPILGICPGAGNPRRRWPTQHFAEVVQILHQDLRPTVVVFAGPEESEAVLLPFRALPRTQIVGGLSIPALSAALAQCRLVLTNPTGPSHIAAAVGARVVTLGEIPAFDPAEQFPGQITAVRARYQVSDIEIPAVLSAVRAAWSSGN